MSTLLDRGIAAHTARMKTGAGRVVVYQRIVDGVLSAVNMTVWPGTATFQRDVADPGASVVQADKCYLFAVADLYLGGANVLPVKGDRIIETIDGQDVTFELMNEKGRPVWEFNDHTRQILRWWGKRVAVPS